MILICEMHRNMTPQHVGYITLSNKVRSVKHTKCVTSPHAEYITQSHVEYITPSDVEYIKLSNKVRYVKYIKHHSMKYTQISLRVQQMAIDIY